MVRYLPIVALGLVILAGCSPAAEVRLLQPQYPGAERDLHLRSNQACWAADKGVERVLAEFPLPGAVAGRPTFLLYLRIPVSAPGVPATQPSTQPIRGFLIQTQGRNAGLETLLAGKVQSKGKSSAPDAVREMQLDLTFEHHTFLSGRLTARRDDRRVHAFETHRRPADVRALETPLSPSGVEP
jgi:hypothetical protein